MTVESKIQIKGFCKKKKNQDIYCYPETPCALYRLQRTGDDQWGQYPQLEKQWENQLEAIKIAKDYYAGQKRNYLMETPRSSG
jgi:hypothetical protein